MRHASHTKDFTRVENSFRDEFLVFDSADQLFHSRDRLIRRFVIFVLGEAGEHQRDKIVFWKIRERRGTHIVLGFTTLLIWSGKF